MTGSLAKSPGKERKSALFLLVLGVLTDNHDCAFSSDDLALLTDFFYGRSDFHLLTFPFKDLLFSPGDATLAEVVDRNLDGYGITGKNFNIVHSQLTRNVGSYDMPVGKLYLEDRVGKCLHNHAFKFNHIILRQNNPSLTYLCFG